MLRFLKTASCRTLGFSFLLPVSTVATRWANCTKSSIPNRRGFPPAFLIFPPQSHIATFSSSYRQSINLNSSPSKTKKQQKPPRPCNTWSFFLPTSPKAFCFGAFAWARKPCVYAPISTPSPCRQRRPQSTR